ncbi:site-specific integrase [Streptomyces sp. NPDC006627]|uniref:site-specific integrase n=1 Tax=Streptomyces sp. NPDC006627 TaxID=3154679 RepID=UPI0033BD2E50
MQMISFSSAGWESWDLARQPLIRERMPVLFDDDLLFEDGPGAPRPATVGNWYLRELPVNGSPAVRTWQNSAGCLRDWFTFLKGRGVHPFGGRKELQSALSMYVEYRLAGPLKDRWDHTTWNLHVGILSAFYSWAKDEAAVVEAVPFTYSVGCRMAQGAVVETKRTLATLRRPRPHTTFKHLEKDFSQLFVRALAGLGSDGEPDLRYRRPREAARNSVMADYVLSSGLRSQEFTHLTTYEVPPLPPRPTLLPVEFPLAYGITKGEKDRVTWIHYAQLAAMHQYIDLDRAASAEGQTWRPPWRLGEPLLVEEPDWEGARLNGVRKSWRSLRPRERLCLVTPSGQSPLVGLQSRGQPFVDWATVFRRTSARIRERYEPRFPTTAPHRLRHSMAMRTLEELVKGRYRRIAQLVEDTDEDAALALWLRKHEPMMILRDLLGHWSVTSTELYIARLDVSRIYRELYESTLARRNRAAEAEAAAEFTREVGD